MPRSRGVPVLVRNRSNLKKVHPVNDEVIPVAHLHNTNNPPHEVRVSMKPTANNRSTMKRMRDAVQNYVKAIASRFTKSKNAKIHVDNFTQISGTRRRKKRYTK